VDTPAAHMASIDRADIAIDGRTGGEVSSIRRQPQSSFATSRAESGIRDQAPFFLEFGCVDLSAREACLQDFESA
jgi:hypothetical protein